MRELSCSLETVTFASSTTLSAACAVPVRFSSELALCPARFEFGRSDESTDSLPIFPSKLDGSTPVSPPFSFSFFSLSLLFRDTKRREMRRLLTTSLYSSTAAFKVSTFSALNAELKGRRPRRERRMLINVDISFNPTLWDTTTSQTTPASSSASPSIVLNFLRPSQPVWVTRKKNPCGRSTLKHSAKRRRGASSLPVHATASSVPLSTTRSTLQPRTGNRVTSIQPHSSAGSQCGVFSLIWLRTTGEKSEFIRVRKPAPFSSVDNLEFPHPNTRTTGSFDGAQCSNKNGFSSVKPQYQSKG
mmetsp:Transcript_8484/g.16545  ORF Transcript_8484/g.16545 Transcript_8484/m.16545 type:complete len:302 (-) Transcript_8484:303-1208(-)